MSRNFNNARWLIDKSSKNAAISAAAAAPLPPSSHLPPPPLLPPSIDFFLLHNGYEDIKTKKTILHRIQGCAYFAEQ